jgi:hypothetical protein
MGFKTFSEFITFARSTTATFVGSDGLIQTAAINAPRFDYDPVTLVAKGFLIEEQRVNLALYSAQFDNAAWTKTSGTITANATTAPDGTLTADKHVPDIGITMGGGAAETRVYQSPSVTIGTNYVFSIYAKAGEYNEIEFVVTATPTVTALFSLTLGTVVSGTGASITPAGNGWYRCTISAPAGATGTAQIRWSAEDSVILVGDGTSGIFVWGAQFEAGSFATSYIPTVASTVTRAAEDITVTGTNFSSWYNQGAGTIVIQFVTITNGVNSTAGNDFPFMYDIDSAAAPTSGHVLILSAGYGPGWNAFTNILGVAQTNLSGAMSLGNASVRKIAYAYQIDDFAVCPNGGTVTTDTLGTLPTNDRMSIGSQNVGGSNDFTGYIQKMTYYPVRLTNAQLQALTT